MAQSTGCSNCAHAAEHVVRADLPDGVVADLIAGDDDGTPGGVGGGCFSGCLLAVAALIILSAIMTVLVYACARL